MTFITFFNFEGVTIFHRMPYAIGLLRVIVWQNLTAVISSEQTYVTHDCLAMVLRHLRVLR